MNPLLSSLQAYPFERLRELLATVTANPAYTPVSLGLGEPRHATPTLIQRAMTDAITRSHRARPATRWSCRPWGG